MGAFKRVADVRCPFFKRGDDERKQVVCEGFVPDSSLAQTYKRKVDYDNQINIFCCEYYKNCEVYRMLMAERFDDYED